VTDQTATALAVTGLVIFAALCFALVLRRIVISRRGGIVECGLRHGPGAAWRHGLAEYRRGQLYWHRSLSLRFRPHAAFDRSQVTVLDTRPAGLAEQVRFGPGMTIVQCRALIRHRGRPAEFRIVELAMTEAALTGLLSWLEASPIYPIRRAS